MTIKKIFLIGGATVWIYPNNIGLFYYDTNTLDVFQFKISASEKLFIELKNKFGIDLNHIVGIEEYLSIEQLEKKVLPFWDIYHRNNGKIVCNSIFQEWSNLSSSAYKIKNGLLWDSSSKISEQLKSLKHGLNVLVELYFKQLSSKIEQKDFEEGLKFKDTNSYPIYYQFQHFIMDCTILRDYLSVFIYEFILEKKTNRKIDCMAQLFKRNLINSDNSDFEKYLNEINEKGNWLNLLNTYRDLIVHCSPLVSAKEELFVECKLLKMKDDFYIPIIECPLPKNPHELRKIRDNDDFKVFEKRLEYYRNDINKIDSTDCLAYAKETLNNLCNLCEKVIELAPIKPKMQTFIITKN